MRLYLAIFVMLVVALPVFSGEAVSSAFTLDLHYESSGVFFPSEEGTEVWGLSLRWTAITTIWANDSNSDGIPDWWEQKLGVATGGLSATGDADGDGFSNIVEYNAGMNPLRFDSLASMSAESLTYEVDTDGRVGSSQGMYDLNEVWSLSSLFSANTAGWAVDSDGDGLPDWYEKLNGLNVSVNDAKLDFDGDGRTNLEEYNAGTDPMNADNWSRSTAELNKAFLCDTRVVYIGGNPSFDEVFAVFHHSEGFVCDTGGLYYDWDGDGIPNWWEARYSRDGGKTSLLGTGDEDSDGMSNYNEFIAYTDPTNTMSRFVLALKQNAASAQAMSGEIMLKTFSVKTTTQSNVSSQEVDSAFVLQWQSAKGRTYSVYSTDSLAGAWNCEAEIKGDGGIVEYTPSSSGQAKFFKISVRLSDDY